MKSAMRLAMVAILVISTGVAKPNPSLLKLTLQVAAEEHCQFSPVAQGLTLHLRMKIVNWSDEEFEVQDAGRPGEILIAKTAGEIRSGKYEFRSLPGEYLDPPPPPNKAAIHVEQGGSFETTQPIDLMVNQSGAAPSSQTVVAGSHYLQVRTSVTVGGANPLTWRYIPVLSEPILVKIEYSPDATPCPRNEPEPISSTPR